MTPDDLKALVRTVPDFPMPGIQFRDITILLADGAGLAASIDLMAERLSTRQPVDAIAGMEARGFIFGAAVAVRLGRGFLPVRKPGKLPARTLGVEYQLEYGSDRLEIDPHAIAPGMRVTIVDDLIATGGTALATVDLLRQAGAVVDHAVFAIDLPDLGGAERLSHAGVAVDALMQFEGD